MDFWNFFVWFLGSGSDPGPVHRQPRPVHAAAQARLDGGAADEGAGQRGEAAPPVGPQQVGAREAAARAGRTRETGPGTAAPPLPGGRPPGGSLVSAVFFSLRFQQRTLARSDLIIVILLSVSI